MSAGTPAPRKLRVATVSLAGCFGCHMSFLDIDERLFDLIEVIEFDRSPLTDIKTVGPCDIGLVEGGLCNAENVEVLRAFRDQCRVLVAVGACAITGGLPALRNHLDVGEMMQAVYGEVPNDPELPLPLNRVLPIHEVVQIDHALPGCVEKCSAGNCGNGDGDEPEQHEPQTLDAGDRQQIAIYKRNAAKNHKNTYR